MASGAPLNRRQWLKTSACTIGAAAAQAEFARTCLAAIPGEAHPLAPKPGHHEPKAKRLIFILLSGGMSQVDTFDPKPALKRDEGKVVTAHGLRGDSQSPILASPFSFQRCGRSGLPISELFPHLQSVADDLCVIRTMHTDIEEHFQATLAIHTGSATVPMPSFGAWISYGLGTFNPNLPSYAVFADNPPFGGPVCWGNSFLPPYHQGVHLKASDEPIDDLGSSVESATAAELRRRMLSDLNTRHADLRPEDLELKARMASFDTAYGMMTEAPEVFDLSRETDATLRDYGFERGDLKSFGWQCLITRRMIERGVRVVELIDAKGGTNWDAHGNMQDHRPRAEYVDRALTGLITDLKRRGLLDETLIAVTTEFGRAPWSDNPGGKGRSHHKEAFCTLLVGGGVRGGCAYGETDEYGNFIAANAVHVHDFHATLLHLLGLDHTKLTYQYAGRDFRLTDVAGRVVQEIIA